MTKAAVCDIIIKLTVNRKRNTKSLGKVIKSKKKLLTNKFDGDIVNKLSPRTDDNKYLDN